MLRLGTLPRISVIGCSNCQWVIETRAYHVMLSFSHMDLETSFDWIRVYDGNSTTARKIAQLTGRILPDPITSSSGTVLVQFLSDASIEYSGFRADYLGLAAISTTATQAPSFSSWQAYTLPPRLAIHVPTWPPSSVPTNTRQPTFAQWWTYSPSPLPTNVPHPPTELPSKLGASIPPTAWTYSPARLTHVPSFFPGSWTWSPARRTAQPSSMPSSPMPSLAPTTRIPTLSPTRLPTPAGNNAPPNDLLVNKKLNLLSLKLGVSIEMQSCLLWETKPSFLLLQPE